MSELPQTVWCDFPSAQIIKRLLHLFAQYIGFLMMELRVSSSLDGDGTSVLIAKVIYLWLGAKRANVNIFTFEKIAIKGFTNHSF